VLSTEWIVCRVADQLYIALDAAYICLDTFDSLMLDAIEVGRIIG
jgi:hypothetical protein